MSHQAPIAVRCASSQTALQVLSSPSEADPLMWSNGFNSLGSYMAAKAQGDGTCRLFLSMKHGGKMGDKH